MEYKGVGQRKFFAELSEHQIESPEFFGDILLKSLERNFGLDKVLISYFDTQGQFLSWLGSKQKLLLNSEKHPYRHFESNDVIRHILYHEAVRDKLTYFNVEPRLYRATDWIDPVDYDKSAYVRFLEENFQAHYSVTMAFGINAYIQVAFFKSLEEGDFTDEEIESLNDIYVYVANAYKNFKKYEQTKIVANIQSNIIASGEKAYLVTDDFMHIMNCNSKAKQYLSDILGMSVEDKIRTDKKCNWLPFLMEGEDEADESGQYRVRRIKGYVFKIHTYEQSYSNGIVDCYYWITISRKEGKKAKILENNNPLTKAERQIAELMYQGLTYQAIADELVISYHTVKKHVQNIYTKCGVNSRYELYKWIEDEDTE
jgi:DNA-binding CsgD family transcriptional regulator